MEILSLFRCHYILHGVEITNSIIHQLIQNGRTEELTLSDQRGFFHIGDTLLLLRIKDIVYKTKKDNTQSMCPDCGGKDCINSLWICVNSINVNSACTLSYFKFHL